jgi:hypothetical protein
VTTYQDLLKKLVDEEVNETRIADCYAAVNNSTQTQGIANTNYVSTSADPWAIYATTSGTTTIAAPATNSIGFTGRVANSQFLNVPPGFHIYVNERGVYEVRADEPPPAVITEAPGPRKPVPALPVEAHRTAEFDSAQAWNATLAACRGQR